MPVGFAYSFGALRRAGVWKKAVSTLVKFALPVFLLTVIINPAFSHGGVTRLCYLPGGNPLTLESIVYGVSAGTMFVTVIMWFCAFNAEFTSDKFIYVFGRIIPSLSLVISMSLRFVPRFKKQLGEITVAQRCIGRDVSSGNLFRRLKIAVSILSIMVTWALQNAIETADSMKSRGYGLKGRTAFSVYRFSTGTNLCLHGYCLQAYSLRAALYAGRLKRFTFRVFTLRRLRTFLRLFSCSLRRDVVNASGR